MPACETPRGFVPQTTAFMMTALLVIGWAAGLSVAPAYGQARSDSGQPAPQRVTSRDREAAKRLYVRVMQEFRKKDYEAALAGFKFFMALHGTSHLAPSAHYWAGECAYRLGRYEDAIESFSHVVQVSEQVPKRASATFKMGLAYRKLGQADQARILFERLLAEYPDSPEVELARKYLGRAQAEPVAISPLAPASAGPPTGSP